MLVVILVITLIIKILCSNFFYWRDYWYQVKGHYYRKKYSEASYRRKAHHDILPRALENSVSKAGLGRPLQFENKRYIWEEWYTQRENKAILISEKKRHVQQQKQNTAVIPSHYYDYDYKRNNTLVTLAIKEAYQRSYQLWRLMFVRSSPHWSLQLLSLLLLLNKSILLPESTVIFRFKFFNHKMVESNRK